MGFIGGLPAVFGLGRACETQQEVPAGHHRGGCTALKAQLWRCWSGAAVWRGVRARRVELAQAICGGAVARNASCAMVFRAAMKSWGDGAGGDLDAELLGVEHHATGHADEMESQGFDSAPHPLPIEHEVSHGGVEVQSQDHDGPPCGARSELAGGEPAACECRFSSRCGRARQAPQR